jgi:hypothetical protein
MEKVKVLFLVNDCVQFDIFFLGGNFYDVKRLQNYLGQTEEFVFKPKHALLKFTNVHQVVDKIFNHVLAKYGLRNNIFGFFEHFHALFL